MDSKLLRAAPSAYSTPSLSKSSKPSCVFALPDKRKCSFLTLDRSVLENRGIRSVVVSASTTSHGSFVTKERVDVSEKLTLESIRHSLIRQEDSVIFGLLEKAQYCYNADTYDPSAFSKNGFHGSLVEYIVKETEKYHAGGEI